MSTTQGKSAHTTPTLESALRAIVAELTGPERPYSGDSYLPAHLVDAAQAALDAVNAQAIAQRQHAHNALSMAAWHVARGEPAQALSRIRRAHAHITQQMGEAA